MYIFHMHVHIYIYFTQTHTYILREVRAFPNWVTCWSWVTTRNELGRYSVC